MTSLRNGITVTMLLVAFCLTSFLSAEEPVAPAPVTLTDQDLESLSPEARKEIEALIRHKHENPDKPPTRVQFGRKRGIVNGDVGPGGVKIQLLGGAIQIGGKNRRRVPQSVAEYRPESELAFPDDLVITMIKRGNDPMFVTIQKGGIEFTIPAEKLEQMIDKYKPYVVQMLQNGLMNSGASPAAPAESPTPGVELGAPSTDLGEPSEIPESDLGSPSPLPPDPKPEQPKEE